MDRALWQKHLAQAEMTVRLGEEHVARQRKLIARFEQYDQDTKRARELLQQFEEMLALHIADRDRLKADLESPH
jgi:hypothetical protein